MFTLAEFETFRAAFDAQFEYGEIKHFTGFHNHELDDRFDNIIDYIKDKITQFFRTRYYGEGEDRVRIFDDTSVIKDLRA